MVAILCKVELWERIKSLARIPPIHPLTRVKICRIIYHVTIYQLMIIRMVSMSPDPVSYLPLTEPTFYILLSLAPGRKHGYAIMKDVRGLSRERVNLSTSTLYTAVGRLLDQELIERLDDGGQDPGPGLPRKSYALTDLGRRVLEAEMVRLQGMVKEARLRLREDGA
ncbi:MAG: hypothetical protein C3F07_16235 [Anaerolineales bacterium]|nr:MAG: hypothetical protein C3F07_16235 [Anaerolineales bacterium]